MADAAPVYRCNHPAELALTVGEASLQSPHVRYFLAIAYPGVDLGRVRANYAEACARIAAVCGATFEPTVDPTEAQVLATTGPIDGPWNVLALSELPPTGGFVGVLHQTFDVAEVLDDATMVMMFAHEMCHILGVGHGAPGNLMAPELDLNYAMPQAWDIAELQARCGPPAPATGGVDQKSANPPAAGGPANTVSFVIDGVGTLTVSGEPAFTVTSGTFAPLAH